MGGKREARRGDEDDMSEGLSSHMKRPWIIGAAVALVAAAGVAMAAAFHAPDAPAEHAAGYAKRLRPHFDHAAVITEQFDSPQAVTRACLACHPEARKVMKTSHWAWLGEEVQIPGRTGTTR